MSEKFNEMVYKTVASIKKTIASKGKEYSGEGAADRFHNFRKAQSFNKMLHGNIDSPEAALWFMLAKHMSSIISRTDFNCEFERNFS